MTDPAPPDGFDPARAQRAVRSGLVSAGLAVGAVLLVVLGIARTEVGSEAVHDVLERMNGPALLAAAALMSLAFVAMALRWRALMPAGHRPPTSGLTAIILAGLLLNYAVPGPFGELGAAWFAHKRYGVPLGGSLASGITARLVGLTTAALLAGGIWLAVDLPVPDGYEAVIGAAAGVSGIGGLALAAMASRPNWWKALARAIAARVPSIGPLPRIAERVRAAVSGLADSLAEVLLRGAGAWARAVPRVSPIIHIKQSMRDKSGHRPFTARYNAVGAIQPEPLLTAFAEGGAVDNEICLELSFKEREPDDRQVIAQIAESVAFWAPHIDSGADDLNV